MFTRKRCRKKRKRSNKIRIRMSMICRKTINKKSSMTTTNNIDNNQDTIEAGTTINKGLWSKEPIKEAVIIKIGAHLTAEDISSTTTETQNTTITGPDLTIGLEEEPTTGPGVQLSIETMIKITTVTLISQSKLID